jgi:hypothetical protein
MDLASGGYDGLNNDNSVALGLFCSGENQGNNHLTENQ